MTGLEHTDDMLLVYLPKERILAEADAFTPPATPTTPLIPAKVPYAAALYANLQRLNLKVTTIATISRKPDRRFSGGRRQAGITPASPR